MGNAFLKTVPRLQTSRFFSLDTSSCPELTFISAAPIWSLQNTHTALTNHFLYLSFFYIYIYKIQIKIDLFLFVI